MKQNSIDSYISQVIDIISDELFLKFGDEKRLNDDIRAEIIARIGPHATTEQIESQLGKSFDWARNYIENSDLPKAVFSSDYVNQKSKTMICGIPLVHVARGTKNGKEQIAKGIIAIGRIAIGVVAFGGIAIGGVVFGGVGLGIITFAGVAVGLLVAIAGVGMGTVAVAGVAMGVFATGGVAIGYFAYGGVAMGYYAVGGVAHGHTAVGGSVSAVEGFGGFMNVQTMLHESHWLVQWSKKMLHSRLQFCLNFIFIIPLIIVFPTIFFAKLWVKRRSRNDENPTLG